MTKTNTIARELTWFRSRLSEPLPLSPTPIEVRRIEPPLEPRPERGPLRVEHRVPRRVPGAALHDHVLAEDAFEGEPEPDRGALRGFVQGVALPLVPPVAQILEGVLRHQVHRLGGSGGPLQRGREEHVADLDHAVGR